MQRITAASFVDEVVVVDRPEAITQLLDRRTVLAGIAYRRRLFARRRGRSACERAGDRSTAAAANAGQIALSYLQTIASDYGAELTGSERAAVPRVEVRNWFNENLHVYCGSSCPA